MTVDGVASSTVEIITKIAEPIPIVSAVKLNTSLPFTAIGYSEIINITDCTFSISRGNSDMILLNLTGTYIVGSDGYGHVKYKIYDANGIIVDNGTALMTARNTGDTVKKTWSSIIPPSSKSSSYTVEFYN